MVIMRMIDQSHVFHNSTPSDWLAMRVRLEWLPDHLWEAAIAADGLPFVYDHVGGLGTNSPRRGVCVQSMGGPYETGYWTLTQNKSQCTLATRRAQMAGALADVIPYLCNISSAHFPSAPLSTASFSLFVANEYLPGEKHSICDHTDAQDWYPSPPIFASITFFPDGPPEDPNQTFRFQVFDEGDDLWKDMYLPDRSVCMMRADIRHRVLPPLSKYTAMSARRINLTYRNLICPIEDPLGYLIGFSNHYRYYGIPSHVIVPKGFDVAAISDVVDRLTMLNDDFEVITDSRTGADRVAEKKKLRTIIRDRYNLSNPSMLSKSNIVLELLEEVIK